MQSGKHATPVIGVGVIGAGTIGSSVARRIHTIDSMKTGKTVRLVGVADTEPARLRKWEKYKTSGNYKDIISDPRVNVVVETAGGAENGRRIMLDALKAGKHVVTANKAAICEFGDEIFAFADSKKLGVGFEASVCAKIPLISYLAGEPSTTGIKKVRGLVNGTTNFILTRMAGGVSYEKALRMAQKKGFAEAKPDFDVLNRDAAQKLAIIASLICGNVVKEKDVHAEPINKVASEDMLAARQFGYVIKNVALAERHSMGLELWVGPTLVKEGDVLASIRDEQNAVAFYSSDRGRSTPMLMSGPGAGGAPTSEAICWDIAGIARGNIGVPLSYITGGNAYALGFEQTSSKYFLRVHAEHTAGSMSTITRILSAYEINILRISQQGRNGSAEAVLPVYFILDETSGKSMSAALADMGREPERIRGTFFMKVD